VITSLFLQYELYGHWFAPLFNILTIARMTLAPNTKN